MPDTSTHLFAQRRIKDLDRLVAQGDTFSLIFRLRGGLSRTQFGLCHEGLFNQAFSGTKVRRAIYLSLHNIFREARYASMTSQ